jgi:hypothetical protein
MSGVLKLRFWSQTFYRLKSGRTSSFVGEKHLAKRIDPRLAGFFTMRYIDSWLTGLGLDYIIPKLKQNGVTTPKKLAQLELIDMYQICKSLVPQDSFRVASPSYSCCVLKPMQWELKIRRIERNCIS